MWIQVENRITLITFGRGRNKKEAKNKMKKSAIIAIIIILLILASVSAVFAATGWFSTSVPATGTINITTTTPAPDFNYTLSPNVAFGTSNFAAGAPVSVTGTILVTNTGNQPINSLTVARYWLAYMAYRVHHPDTRAGGPGRTRDCHTRGNGTHNNPDRQFNRWNIDGNNDHTG